MDQIAGTKGLPKRVLLGSEVGDLASTQDKKRVDDRKDEHIRDCSEPALRQFLNRMIQHGGVRSPLKKGRSYKVIWPKEEEMSEVEKAETVSKLTLANLNQSQATGEVILSSDEIRDQIYGKKPLEVKVPATISNTSPDNTPPDPSLQSPDNGIDNVDLIQ